MRLVLVLCAAGLIAGCSQGKTELATTTAAPGEERQVQVMPVDPVGIRPIPPIPAALHGCWDAPAPEDPVEPGGAVRAVIDATSITQSSEGTGTKVATAQFVEEVSATSISGRFSAPHDGHLDTIATSLALGPDERFGIPAGVLRIAEGDAGSAFLERCVDGVRPERG